MSTFCISFSLLTICTWSATLKSILNCINLIMIWFLWWRCHNGHNIGYDKSFSVFCFFRLLPTDVAWDNIFFFCSCRVISFAYCFGKMAPVTAIMDVISLWFSAMDNALLHASGHYPAEKTRITDYYLLEHCTFIFIWIRWWMRQHLCRCKHIGYILWWYRILIFIINHHYLCIGYFWCSLLLDIHVSAVST